MGNLLTCCVEEGGVITYHGVFRKAGNWTGNENVRYVILQEGLLSYYKETDFRTSHKMKREVVFKEKQMTLEILGIIDLLTYELLDPFARNTNTLVFARKQSLGIKRNPLLDMRDQLVGNDKELQKTEDHYTFECKDVTERMEWAAFVETHKVYAYGLSKLG